MRTLRLYDGYITITPYKSNDVARLQRLLRRIGYSLDVDGEYGPQTEATVRLFQRHERLEVDGICGPDTWNALEARTGEVTEEVIRRHPNGVVGIITALAEADIGQTEKRGNRGFHDPAFESAMRRAGWRKGWAWCLSWIRKILLCLNTNSLTTT